MDNAKPASTPLSTIIRLSDKDSPSAEEERKLNGNIPYTVGSIMYAMVATRPDLAHAVGVVSQHMSNPGRKHWQEVKHILRYLRGKKDAQMTFGSKNSTKVEGYTDSDYPGTQIIGSRLQGTYSPMPAVPYHGGRNFKSARPCLP